MCAWDNICHCDKCGHNYYKIIGHTCPIEILEKDNLETKIYNLEKIVEKQRLEIEKLKELYQKFENELNKSIRTVDDFEMPRYFYCKDGDCE